MNILFASSEVAPFAKTGGLADVAGSLPKALSSVGCNLRVILPFYRCVKALKLQVEPFKCGNFNFLRHRDNGVEYIFVVNDNLYDRENLYSEPNGDYPDNYLRFSYYSKAIVELATKSDPEPDVINCNDWQTGLVPLYLKIKKSRIKTLFSIHNIAYQGIFKKEILEEIDIPRDFYTTQGIEYYGKVCFLKAGLIYSTAISTVSKKYGEEILTKEFGCGMDGILRMRQSDLYGILNGVDYSKWDPEIDRFLACNYNSETVQKKTICKKDIIEVVNLPAETIERPLIGVISRLAEQKGIDLLVEAAGDIIKLGASMIILGTGDEKYNMLCRQIGERFPKYISSNVKFDNALAHKIEAGSDFFVMPSRYEPCGLNQLYSLRYGTLPVVRRTGGLDDTIIDLYEDTENGNGIKFEEATKKEMLEALSRAIELMKDKASWQNILKRIMKIDFSWKRSALHYKELYRSLAGQ